MKSKYIVDDFFILFDYSKSGCWSRRSSLEKRLTVISILATAVAIAFVIALIVVVFNNDNNNNDNIEDGLESVCLTQECISESNSVLRNMNLEANPYVNQNKINYSWLLIPF